MGTKPRVKLRLRLKTSAAVYFEIGTCDNARFVRGEKEKGIGDFLWLDKTPHWRPGDAVLEVFWVINTRRPVVGAIGCASADKGRVHMTGRNQVAADVVGGIGAGRSPGQAQNTDF